jgi:hypothetical protein
VLALTLATTGRASAARAAALIEHADSPATTRPVRAP